MSAAVDVRTRLGALPHVAVSVLGPDELRAGGFGGGVLGRPGFPLGTAFVSNVGSLGLDEAFLAPLPFARTPVYLAGGAIQDKAVVVDGEAAMVSEPRRGW